jgi:hypothetical protein
MNDKVSIEVAQYEDYYCMDYNLKDFINKLNKDLNKIPDDFVDKASIGIYAKVNQYSDTTVELTISYERPKTIEEIAEEYEFIKTQQHNQRERDLKEYNRLKERLGL